MCQRGVSGKRCVREVCQGGVSGEEGVPNGRGVSNVDQTHSHKHGNTLVRFLAKKNTQMTQ